MDRELLKLLKKIEICFVLQQEGRLIQTDLAEKIGDTNSKNSKTHGLLNELNHEGLVDAPNAKFKGDKRYCVLTKKGKEFVKELLELARKFTSSTPGGRRYCTLTEQCKEFVKKILGKFMSSTNPN